MTNDAHAGSFVWVAGMKNFSPQKWPAENPNLPKPKAGTYKEHKLSAEEFALPIEELARRYPPPPNVGQNPSKTSVSE